MAILRVLGTRLGGEGLGGGCMGEGLLSTQLQDGRRARSSEAGGELSWPWAGDLRLREGPMHKSGWNKTCFILQRLQGS